MPSDLKIRAVSNREALVDFKRVTVEGFPFDEHRPFDADAWLDERVLEMPGHQLFVGYADGEAVASGWLLLHAGLGVPIIAATLPHARNRGYWRGMLSWRLQAADGYPFATLFSDMSRPARSATASSRSSGSPPGTAAVLRDGFVRVVDAALHLLG